MFDKGLGNNCSSLEQRRRRRTAISPQVRSQPKHQSISTKRWPPTCLPDLRTRPKSGAPGRHGRCQKCQAGLALNSGRSRCGSWRDLP